MNASASGRPPRLISVNVGRPQIVLRDGRQYSTAINRRPVEGRVHLTADGIDGDRVADRNVHGGPDKAICCYPIEHYPHFSGLLGVELTTPSFGENLTTSGLLENAVCLGDTFRVGTAIVQISQPKQPCWKLAGKHRQPRMIEWIYETGFCGFYVRVLQPGEVAAGDAIELIERGHADLTIARLLRERSSTAGDRAQWGRLACLPELAQSWRRHFQKRLAGDDEQEE